MILADQRSWATRIHDLEDRITRLEAELHATHVMFELPDDDRARCDCTQEAKDLERLRSAASR